MPRGPESQPTPTPEASQPTDFETAAEALKAGIYGSGNIDVDTVAELMTKAQFAGFSGSEKPEDVYRKLKTLASQAVMVFTYRGNNEGVTRFKEIITALDVSAELEEQKATRGKPGSKPGSTKPAAAPTPRSMNQAKA